MSAPLGDQPPSDARIVAPWINFRHVLAAIIGGIFIYAGVLKVAAPVAFARDISNFHILPWGVGVRLAFYLPWLEIISGGALLVTALRAGATAILTGLTVVFIGATIAARLRGIDVNCGCFGAASKDLSFGWHLALDFAVLGALILLWSCQPAATRDWRVVTSRV